QVLFDVIPRRCGDTTWSSGRSTRLPFALWPQRDRCMMRSVGVGCCYLVIDLFLRRVRRCNAVTRTRRLRPMPQRASPIWASTETRSHPSSPHGTPSEPSHRILLGSAPRWGAGMCDEASQGEEKGARESNDAGSLLHPPFDHGPSALDTQQTREARRYAGDQDDIAQDADRLWRARCASARAVVCAASFLRGRLIPLHRVESRRACLRRVRKVAPHSAQTVTCCRFRRVEDSRSGARTAPSQLPRGRLPTAEPTAPRGQTPASPHRAERIALIVPESSQPLVEKAMHVDEYKFGEKRARRRNARRSSVTRR